MLCVCRLERESEEKRPEGKRTKSYDWGRQTKMPHSPHLPQRLHLCFCSNNTFTTPEGSCPTNPPYSLSGGPCLFNDNESLRLLPHLSPFLPCLSSLNPRSPSLLPATPFWASVFTHTGETLPEFHTQYPLTCHLHLFFSKAHNIFPIL